MPIEPPPSSSDRRAALQVANVGEQESTLIRGQRFDKGGVAITDADVPGTQPPPVLLHGGSAN
jgi:hypothetical protein